MGSDALMLCAAHLLLGIETFEWTQSCGMQFDLVKGVRMRTGRCRRRLRVTGQCRGPGMLDDLSPLMKHHHQYVHINAVIRETSVMNDKMQPCHYFPNPLINAPWACQHGEPQQQKRKKKNIQSGLITSKNRTVLKNILWPCT